MLSMVPVVICDGGMCAVPVLVKIVWVNFGMDEHQPSHKDFFSYSHKFPVLLQTLTGNASHSHNLVSCK